MPPSFHELLFWNVISTDALFFHQNNDIKGVKLQKFNNTNQLSNKVQLLN